MPTKHTSSFESARAACGSAISGCAWLNIGSRRVLSGGGDLLCAAWLDPTHARFRSGPLEWAVAGILLPGLIALWVLPGYAPQDRAASLKA